MNKKTEQEFLCITKIAWIRKSGLVLIVLLLVTFSVAFYTGNMMNKGMTNDVLQFLSRYTQSFSTQITAPIEKVSNQVFSLVSMLDDENASQVEEELRFIVRNNTGKVRDISIFSPVTTTSELYREVTPYGESIVSLSSTKWSSYLTEFRDQNFSYAGSFVYWLLPSFRDSLNSFTILPAMFSIKDANGIPKVVFIEFNLTRILLSLTDNLEVPFSGKATRFEVNVYDKEHRLLETSRNLRKFEQPLFEVERDLSRFTSFNRELGLFYQNEGNRLTMLSSNAELGLITTVSVPDAFITNRSNKMVFFILFIGFLCLVGLVWVIRFTFRVFNDYQTYEREENLTKFEALQSKMNPHFLFNTLDSLAYSVEEGEKESSLKCIKNLSYILHFDLRERENIIPLSEQIKYVRSYVNLQEIRYRDMFDFHMDVDVGSYGIDDVRVLKYCVQPIVENCFVHSVYQGIPFTHIQTTYRIEDGKLSITVTDDGPEMPKQEREELVSTLRTKETGKSSHIGLRNINARINLLYGKTYGLSLVTVAKGFSVNVILPLLSEE